MNAQKTQEKRESGYISLEMLVVLILIGIGLAGVLYAAYKMFSTSDLNTEQANIMQLSTNTRALRSTNGYGSSGTDLVTSLVATKGIPTGMSNSGNNIYNVFGGAVTVVSTGVGFTITSAGLPKDACITLATKLGRTMADSTQINGGSALTGDITLAQATSGCSSDSNTVAWTTTR